MTIELFQFQQTAASQVADRFVDYNFDPVRIGRKNNARDLSLIHI